MKWCSSASSAVRLRRGAMDQATVYSSDPAGQARVWQDAGFAWLHVVDLNGAFAGRPVNAEAVGTILAAVTIPVQLGGGIRDMAGIERWLAAGILAMAAADTALVISDQLQKPNSVLNAAHPAAPLLLAVSNLSLNSASSSAARSLTAQ